MIGKLIIKTAADHPAELRTLEELVALLAEHDCSGLRWASRLLIRRGDVPHSHPTLTLNTRSSGDGLLAIYLHEQLHWWTVRCPGTQPAIEATRQDWPSVPAASAGGARDDASTRLHLIVCFLEQRGLEHVLGASRATAIARGDLYQWVYRQVIERADVLSEICDRHGLWPPALAEKLPG